jgi:hypothetical protein
MIFLFIRIQGAFSISIDKVNNDTNNKPDKEPEPIAHLHSCK